MAINVNANVKNTRFQIATTLGIAIFLVYFIFSLQYKVPVYLSDETAYMTKAAAIAGYPTDMASSWYAGYPLLLSPLFWIFSDPFIIWKGVLFLNALMFGASFAILFYLMVYIFPDKSAGQILTAVTVSALYPAFITMSGYSFATPGFVLCFMLILLTLPKCFGAKGRSWSLVNAFLVGYLTWIHPVAMGVVAVYILLLLFGGRKVFKNIFPQILVAVLMMLGYKLAIHPWLNNIMTPEGYSVAVHYPSVSRVLLPIFNIDKFINILFVFFGQYSYFTVATLGFSNVFFIKLFRMIKDSDEYSFRKDPSFYMLALAGLSFLAIIAIAGIAIAPNAMPVKTAFHYLLYGRYLEHVALPVLCVGLLSCDLLKQCRWLILCQSLLMGYLFWAPSLTITGWCNWINISGYWPAILLGENKFYICALVTVLILLCVSFLNKKSFIVLLALYVTCIVHQNNWHINIQEANSKPSEFVYYIRSTFPVGTLVAFDERRVERFKYNESYQLYSYYLYDYNYRRMSLAEWENMEDGVLLTYAPEETNPDKNFVIGKEDRAGLFMVVKKGSSMDLFSYKPAKNWLFKANFAESFDNNNTIYNIHKYASNLPTQSGKKSDGSIYSTGHNGTLVYGPYNTIKAGKYHLTVMGHIDSVDKAYLDIVSQQGAKQYAFFKLEPSIVASDGIILQEDFVISEDVTDYEVRIFVGEQDNIRFDGYQIELLVTDLNMPPSTEQ